jgi:hypothetical protein
VARSLSTSPTLLETKGGQVSERNKLAFCWLVGLGWLANLAAGMVPSLHYKPDLVTNGPMMLVLGAVLATTRKKAKPGDDNA